MHPTYNQIIYNLLAVEHFYTVNAYIIVGKAFNQHLSLQEKKKNCHFHNIIKKYEFFHRLTNLENSKKIKFTKPVTGKPVHAHITYIGFFL